ncbi:MAG: DNA primase [Ignavibacteria bacterium]|nr:DNA primase [Ignavibacteria bacterium]
MRIPDAAIDEIRTSSDIVDVISSSLKLKKRGKNYVGLCPFHQEKTPSFNVSPDRQMYHCFGCGAGGNVFTFVMETEKVSFIEAVRTLADRAGIALPSPGREDSAKATEAEILYGICRKAETYFQENLTATVEGKLALEYFRHRGFSDDTMRTFGLGYAMNSWDGFVKFVEREGIDQALAEKAGLITRREDGSGYYDRFRGRAMFPIYSASGRIIAFGARKMRDEDQLAKYINSPETPIYSKSRVLYGLFQAREAIREKEYAILVEGYADLLSLYQAEIRNCVASSGTALAVEQIQLLSRYTKTITLVYDADSAGSKATMRGVDLIIEQGMEVLVAELPAGEDPDSFVRSRGAAAFRDLLGNAVTFLDFKAKLFETQGLLATPEGHTRAIRSIVETIARMKDEIKQQLYIKSLAEKYGLYETTLFRELERLSGPRSSAQRPQPAGMGGKEYGASDPPAAGRPTPVPAVERDLLKLMLDYGPTMVRYITEHSREEQFEHPLVREALEMIRERMTHDSSPDTSSLITHLDNPALKDFISEVVFSKYELSAGWARIGSLPKEADPWEVADRCLILLHRKDIDRLLSENQRRMKEASLRGEPMREFLEHHQTLLSEKKSLDEMKHTEPLSGGTENTHQANEEGLDPD